MTLVASPAKTPITRRSFLTAGACAVGGLALYSGEIERHWIEVSRRDVFLPGLRSDLDGLSLAQLSDIHLDQFTEPFFLRDAVQKINGLKPDVVLLTGDYITYEDSYRPKSRKRSLEAAWQCAEILKGIECKRVFAVLGNHDSTAGKVEVTAALAASGFDVLNNRYLPLERGGARMWVAGLEDPLKGDPNPDMAVPPAIRRVASEPVMLLCHCPDYADTLLTQPAGQSVALMVSGHTHGGQVRLPIITALNLPALGRKYVEGWFQLGSMQLHVNRGLGTLGVPFRFNCPPEISLLRLRAQD